MTSITITFDGEVWVASLKGTEVGADRSLGQLKVRLLKRYGKETQFTTK